MNEKYIVIVNDDIVGHFAEYDQALLFQHITAYHSSAGDKIYLCRIEQMIEVIE